jgi:diamine N-acetyltransferase
MNSKNDVYLSPLEKNDVETLYQWINDKELVHYNSCFKPVSWYEHDEWMKNTLTNPSIILFGIRLVENQKLIGTCKLHSINYIDRKAELQIRIGVKEILGKGYGTQVIRQLLEFAFSELNLNKVYLYVFIENVRAVKSYQKVGFKVEGTLIQDAHINGRYLDSYIMGILRSDFNKK